MQWTDAQTSGYNITLMMKTGKMKTLWIPESPEGKYYFENDVGKNIFHLIYLEAKNKRWYACCLRPAFFQSTKEQEMCETTCIEIYDKCFACIKIVDSECVLYVEASSRESNIYYNYFVANGSEFTIGRQEENDIVYPNRYVSKTHSKITYGNGEWKVFDLGSTNGTFVNGIRKEEQSLTIGDTVYIMGLRVNIGAGFISINSGNDRVRIDSNILKPTYNTIRSDALGKRMKKLSRDKAIFFNRLPRKRVSMKINTISIEAPPLSLKSNQIPLFLRMGSSMVMSGAAMMAGNFTSMISMVLFPVLNQKYTDKEKKEYEERRIEKYSEYLAQKEFEIQKEKEYEERELNHIYPPCEVILDYAANGEKLWERSKFDHDFLTLRIGHGKLPLLAKYEYPEKKFSLDEDELENKMYRLANKQIFIENVPIMLALTEQNICGIVGSVVQKFEFIKRLIVQICFLHGYDEVKLIFLSENVDLEQISFVRFLPHVWNDERVFRYVATDTKSAYMIDQNLGREIETDIQKPRELKKILKERPYYLVFALSEKIFNSMDTLKKVLTSDSNMGVSLLTFFDRVPKECQLLIKLDDSRESLASFLKKEEAADIEFCMDALNFVHAEKMMHVMANIKLNIGKLGYTLPPMLTFLELFGVGKVEHLNSLQRWKENNPIYSLAVPIGVTTEGTNFMLDLHEKYQGPHGLVAGMTGSGKSEFLITYILSLAVNFHPDEVAFVLIDYKGGGLAGAFDDESRGIHLPHLVGTITNLDGSAIQRSLMSIESELKRRQKIFNEVKSIANEGTMDIYAYQKLYRSGKVRIPLPHLFIISDEFAELKSQEPEFMDQLISTARIGRSLGIHLILATQKPAGVVNDQINSNAKFRVCLKVQTRADSDELLGRPEAAGLKETGRFYLQVGYDELFALGQSAWCGASYEPQEEVIVHRDEYVQFVNETGQSTIQVKPLTEKKESGSSQLTFIVKYLSGIAVGMGIVTKKLWLDPLPDRISLAALYQAYQKEIDNAKGIKVMIGLVDDPENQKQFPLEIDFCKKQNLMIVGNNRSGKTTILETLLYCMAFRYTPGDVNYYILDFSSNMLSVFDKVPHCGGVWGEDDRKEIEIFFGMLNEIIAERKSLFLQASVSSFESYCEIKKIPVIFVLIDNITGLSAWKCGEDIYYKLNLTIREANSVGIKFIITAGSVDDVMYQVKKEFDLRLVLNAKNRFEYGDILGVRCSFEPAVHTGRGMCRNGDRVLEMQIARFSVKGTEQQRLKKLKEDIGRRAQEVSCLPCARRIQMIREDETYHEFCTDILPGRIPLGYSAADIKKISIPLGQFFCMSLYFGNPTGITPVIQNYLEAAIRENMHLIVVRRNQDSVFETEQIQNTVRNLADNIIFLNCTAEDSEKFWKMMVREINMRKEIRNQYCAMHNLASASVNVMKKCRNYIRDNTYPLMVLFESFADFCKTANKTCEDAMLQIMRQGGGYHYYFIGCYAPDDTTRIAANEIHKAFNPDKFILLYGGQFHRQNMVALPLEYRGMSKSLKKYNTCLMQYHGELYPLMMPCGNLKKTAKDADDEDIIG